jgi:predicted nucleic-acid-binding Zn-ribbon protein
MGAALQYRTLGDVKDSRILRCISAGEREREREREIDSVGGRYSRQLDRQKRKTILKTCGSSRDELS